MTSIEKGAFRNTAISAFAFPPSVTTIEEYTFYGCMGLTSVILPNALTSCENSFEHCLNLAQVTIPSSLTSFQNTFDGCWQLKDVTVLATHPPFIVSSTFDTYDATLHVLPGCGEAYKADSTWKRFTNIVEDAKIDTGILIPTLSEGENTYYDLQGRQVQNAKQGIYIVNGRKVVVK